MFEIPEGYICTNCKKRLATTAWTGHEGIMAAVHGNFTFWCGLCSTISQLAFAKERAAAIPELEAQIKALQEKEV